MRLHDTGVALFLPRLIGYLLRDIVITRDEIDGSMSDLLVSEVEAKAPTLFSEWLAQNTGNIGIRYISGLERRYR